MNNHAAGGISVPPRHVALLCHLLGCAADDLPDALADLDDDDPGFLLHPSGARVRLVVATPFRDGITWRVAGIERPAAPTPAPSVVTTAPQPTLAERLGPYRTLLEISRTCRL